MEEKPQTVLRLPLCIQKMTRSYFTCVVLFLALIVLFTSTNAFQWDLERRCFTPPEITTLKETCMEFHLDTCEGLALEMIVTYDGVALIDQEVEDLTEEEVCQDIDAAVGYNGCKTCISFKQGQDFVLKPNFVRLCPIITTKCSLPFLNGDIPINVQELDCFELGSRCDELVVKYFYCNMLGSLCPECWPSFRVFAKIAST